MAGLADRRVRERQPYAQAKGVGDEDSQDKERGGEQPERERAFALECSADRPPADELKRGRLAGLQEGPTSRCRSGSLLLRPTSPPPAATCPARLWRTCR